MLKGARKFKGLSPEVDRQIETTSTIRTAQYVLFSAILIGSITVSFMLYAMVYANFSGGLFLGLWGGLLVAHTVRHFNFLEDQFVSEFVTLLRMVQEWGDTEKAGAGRVQ